MALNSTRMIRFLRLSAERRFLTENQGIIVFVSTDELKHPLYDIYGQCAANYANNEYLFNTVDR